MSAPTTVQQQPPSALLFRSLIRFAAAEPSHREAVLTDNVHRCRHAEVPGHLDSIEAFLRRGGVRPDDCIAVELDNSVRSALCMLAVLDQGYSVVQLPAPGHGGRVEGDDYAYPAFCRWVLTVKPQAPAGSLDAVSPLDYLRLRANERFRPRQVLPAGDERWFFYRTSGSLGAAKLVMYSYGQLYLNIAKTIGARRFDPSYRVALPIPIYHGYGFQAGLLAAFHGGASVDYQDRSNALRFLEREAEFEPNVALVTPSFCDILVRLRRARRPYRYIFTGGDRLSEATFRRSERLHGPLLNGYGTSELGMLTCTDADMPYELRAGTVGKPLPGVELRIVPVEGDAAPGQGELEVRTRYGYNGYVDLDGRPVGVPRRFDDAWLRTGDLAAEGPEGTIVVLGRCDISVNRQGVLLPLGEVENRLMSLPGVEEAAVAAGPETARGRAIVAFCVLTARSEADAASLRSLYADGAPAFSVPDVVRIVAELPKLGSGKVDRQALAKLAQNP